ncbi:hypothetical protein F5B17DRAFT_359781 [Nemania serpens]|nr:hypothetical protein F5B17DRAFT_359781 [Nemania serpens]
MATQPLFGLLPAGQPLQTTPTSQPNPTSFLYFLPGTTPSNPRPFAHLAVFLLPGVSLPPNTAAAIYFALNPSAFAPGGPGSAAANFKFLGGVGPGKESAVFKLGGGGGNNNSDSNSGGGFGMSNDGNNDSDMDAWTAADGVVIGIDIEDATSVAQRIQQLQLQSQSQSQSTALVPATGGGGIGALDASAQVRLAQRIIQNAFNFLSSFSGQIGQTGVEVVPLKAFQEWWRKFETKIRNDPGFLERQQD